MYNLAVTGNKDKCSEIAELFGEKYDITDDFSQTNVLVICSNEGSAVPDSKLLFAVCDMTEEGLHKETVTYCAERGIAVFRCDDIRQSVSEVQNFIENGNLTGNTGFPDIELGPFGSDLCRIIIMTKGIDDPILLTAMMFSGLDVRAVAGGLYHYQNPACCCTETSPTDTADPENDANKNSDAETADLEINANKNSESDSAVTEELYGCALVALREPVVRIPHVDGVLKVRVLQDI